MAEKVYLTESDYSEIQASANIEGLNPIQWLLANDIVEPSIDNTQAAENWEKVMRQRCDSVRMVEVPYRVWYLLRTKVIGGADETVPAIVAPTRQSVGSPIDKRPVRKPKPPETIRPSPKGFTIATWVEKVACISFQPKRQMAEPKPPLPKQGVQIIIATDGFKPNENVVIDFGTTANIVTVVADAFGAIQAAYTISTLEPVGEKIVVAIGQTSNVYQEAIVEVILA